MANSVSHASLPYVIKGARYTIAVPYLDADGDPTDPTTPDTEFSLDAGSFADCAEEVTTITGSNGVGYITLSGAETNGSMLAVVAKVASGPKNTILTTNIRQLVSVSTGTLSAGSAGGGTLGTILAYDITGCFIKTTGGTGGGGTGGANNQARRIITYTTSTGAFTVSPNWETTPDNTTTYDILLPDSATLAAMKALNPTVAGRTLDVASTGEAGLDFDNILLTNGQSRLGIFASGTLSGTHSSTTADLGTNAPSVDITGKILNIPTHGVSRVIDSYNTGTGVATFSPSTGATLANGDAWYLFDSPLASTSAIPNVNVTQISGDSVAADNCESFFDGTGYAGTGNTIPTVTTVNGLAANVITAAATATDFGTEIFNAVMTSQLTESYNTDGTAPTAAQALFLIMQMLTERSVASTTLTVKKLDGSTTAATFTLDSASAPTSVTRTT